MGAKELFQAGKLNEAVQALGAEVRDNPTDVRRRTFLFELLCFQGEFDRAEKHLHVLAGINPEAQLGAVLYFSALHAERVRHDLFAKKEYPSEPAAGNSRGGTIDGRPFETLEDADPRVGPRLELFAAGAYLWIPFEHIEAIEIQKPSKLRDLLWVPALVRTGPSFKGTELGEVLLPVLSPFSFKSPDENVRLGRATVWQEQDGVQVPLGQRLFSVDEDEVSLLDTRKIEFVADAEVETEAEATAPSGT
jgi:type VI secretion system protein ImpE